MIAPETGVGERPTTPESGAMRALIHSPSTPETGVLSRVTIYPERQRKGPLGVVRSARWAKKGRKVRRAKIETVAIKTG